LRMADVFDVEGKVKPEIQLDGERVKNKHARTVSSPTDFARNSASTEPR
jgi:hypothetical protein